MTVIETERLLMRPLTGDYFDDYASAPPHERSRRRVAVRIKGILAAPELSARTG
ncbi:hypothetical protein AB0L53_07590 [Nonomuraea sp. NPDC052129]|uniref:hypothetical protein n=1 Tax=Nonomuraea sp. NPDC052129 TaxID=3154651 RepID=UPI0034127F3B